jgi:hypothetical protein
MMSYTTPSVGRLIWYIEFHLKAVPMQKKVYLKDINFLEQFMASSIYPFDPFLIFYQPH